MKIDAFFLPAENGQRLCLLRRPELALPARGSVVYVHPFAEEMNKSRRMAALQARALAEAGYWVLQVDLRGCGDSSGDFGDAAWSDWVDDVAMACGWIREQTGAPLWLWGLRTGCLLASEASRRVGATGLLLWQPVLSGKQFLQQFLRLRIAGDMLTGDSKGAMDRMRQQLAVGESVEVGGYKLSSGLANGLGKAELSLPDGITRVEWLELSGKPESELSPAAAMRLDQWKLPGRMLNAQVVCGPAFWQTAEIEECPALIEASVSAIAEGAEA